MVESVNAQGTCDPCYPSSGFTEPFHLGSRVGKYIPVLACLKVLGTHLDVQSICCKSPFCWARQSKEMISVHLLAHDQ